MQPTRSGSDGRRPTRTQAGFSLVEVLAALVIACLLLTGLTPFVGQMLSTWARGSTTGLIVDMVSRGIGQLRSDLRHAVPLPAREGFLAFRGDETAFEFPAATGLGAGRYGVEMIAVSVEKLSGNELALVRRRSRLIEGGISAEFKDPVVLFSGKYQYVFQYVGREGTRQSTWTDRPELPALVELDILSDHHPLLPTFALPLFPEMTIACLLQPAPGCPVAAEVAKQVQLIEQMSPSTSQ